MANDDFIQQSDKPTPTPTFRDWSSHLSYSLFEFAYQAKAARALLHECEKTEGDETLMGVSYLLGRMATDCEKLSGDISGRWLDYIRKEEASHG